jgi:hypothetical protein
MLEEWTSGKGQRVEIWTDAFHLVGHIFLPEGIAGGSARLSDVLNQNRQFIPLARVTMHRRDDDQILGQQEFLLVNRDHVELIRPLD